MGGTRGRVGIKDVSDPNLIVLRCPLNLLRIFQDVAHRSKTEFMLGPSSGVKIKKSWTYSVLGTLVQFML